eukprot:scaffold5060_cov123-Isochrysis_galbana.AAC.13
MGGVMEALAPPPKGAQPRLIASVLAAGADRVEVKVEGNGAHLALEGGVVHELVAPAGVRARLEVEDHCALVWDAPLLAAEPVAAARFCRTDAPSRLAVDVAEEVVVDDAEARDAGEVRALVVRNRLHVCDDQAVSRCRYLRRTVPCRPQREEAGRDWPQRNARLVHDGLPRLHKVQELVIIHMKQPGDAALGASS